MRVESTAFIELLEKRYDNPSEIILALTNTLTANYLSFDQSVKNGYRYFFELDDEDESLNILTADQHTIEKIENPITDVFALLRYYGH